MSDIGNHPRSLLDVRRRLGCQDDKHAIDMRIIDDWLQSKAVAIGSRISQNVDGIGCAGGIG